MILRPEALEAAIDCVPYEGICTVDEAFDPDQVIDEVIDRNSLAPGVGQRSMDMDGNAHQRMYELGLDNTLALATALGEVATKAGYPDWVPNYLLVRVTEQGFRWHPDNRANRYFNFFAQLHGETELLQRWPDDSVTRHKAGPGAITVMRQGLDYDDHGPLMTRTMHMAEATGVRAFLSFNYECDVPTKPFDIATKQQIAA